MEEWLVIWSIFYVINQFNNFDFFFLLKLGGANTNVEDMEEGSSSEEDEDDEDAVPQPIGKPLMAVDAAPAVQQPPPALPTRENVEVR